jgi:competence ComEA-like helix-hairpin-helix protein
MNTPSPATEPSSPALGPFVLRRGDQTTVAMWMLLIFAAIGGWRVANSGENNRLVEADNYPPCAASFQVDINAADLPELIMLPGIGDTLAQRIIEVRKNNGPYTKPDDLLEVRGIGIKIMERLRPYVLTGETKSTKNTSE